MITLFAKSNLNCWGYSTERTVHG